MTIDLLILFDSDSVSLYISGHNEMKLLDVLGIGMSNLQKQVKYSSVPIILYFIIPQGKSIFCRARYTLQIPEHT